MIAGAEHADRAAHLRWPGDPLRQAVRRARRRHRVGLSGVHAHPRPERRGEHLRPPGQRLPLRLDPGPRRHRPTGPGALRAHRHRRTDLARREGVDALGGAAAARRDRQGHRSRRAAHHPRRADFRALAPGGAPRLRPRPLARGAGHRLHLRHAPPRRGGRDATSVTVLRDGRTILSRVPAAEVTTDAIIRAMVGRDIDQSSVRAHPAVAGEPLLSVRGLGRRTRLRDISFEVHAGEIVGVAGLVGSGRTELLRAIFGAEPADRGEIRVRGRTVRIGSPKDAIRHGIAMVPEDRKRDGLLLLQSIRQNLNLPWLSLEGGWRLQRTAEAGRATAMSGRLGIRSSGVEQRAESLSGGNQQKVVWASGSSTSPPCCSSTIPRGASTSAPRRASTGSSTISPRRAWASSSSPARCPSCLRSLTASSSCARASWRRRSPATRRPRTSSCAAPPRCRARPGRKALPPGRQRGRG